MPTSNISANELLSSYTLFNATDIKSFIINQLKTGENPAFKDVDYLGSNLNTFIDTLAVLLQQILFTYNVNVSETGFNNAVLYESMNKLVSILNYKTTGKQTSMLPVRLKVSIPRNVLTNDKKSFTVPKFLTVNYNSSYVLKNEIVKPLNKNSRDLYIDAILFQGAVNESPMYTAIGDEFELITLVDHNINKSKRFISDNFFTVYVDEFNDGNWQEYKEVTSIYDASQDDTVYERRFTEGFNYEFKFGNGVNGRKLVPGARIVIFYILSSGEEAQIGSETLLTFTPTIYSSALYGEIYNAIHNTNIYDISEISYITVSNTGPSTDISYPESVASIRKNAPKVFSSQSRLFSLADYKTFIDRNFSSYCRDTYLMNNDEYVSSYLRYYYDLGVDNAKEDSRLNLAQMEFMTATNFNNVYAAIVPRVNTIISDKVPNYLNTALKQEIVEMAKPYQGLTHNLVPMDPIYKAFTFGSYALDDDVFNEKQLQNVLVIKRNRLTKYSQTFIKEQVVALFNNYFNSMTIGQQVDTASLTQQLLNIPGVKSFYIKDVNSHEENKLTWFTWNPLYSSEDQEVTTQNVMVYPFTFCYFYDLKNIKNIIEIEEES